MTKTTRLLCTIAAATWSLPAAAQSTLSIDCSILGDLARQHTVARLTEFTRRHEIGTPSGYVDYRRLQICDQTALAATSGFSAAMSQFGMPVRWSVDDRAAHCPGTDLSQCMPFGDPAAAPLSAAERRFVSSAWRELQSGVGAHMPWGVSSNLSYFSVESMTQSFGGGGLPQAGDASIGGDY